MTTIPTRQQYEGEISRLNGLIVKAKREEQITREKQASDMRSSCAGMDNYCGGMTCCERWKRDVTKVNQEAERNWFNKAEQHKQELWDYQKHVAKLEQDAQIEAVRQAIADQVKAEQEKIQAQQLAEQQQEKLIETVEIKNPIAQLQKEIIQPQTNNQNLILPLAVVAGVLLL